MLTTNVEAMSLTNLQAFAQVLGMIHQPVAVEELNAYIQRRTEQELEKLKDNQ